MSICEEKGLTQSQLAEMCNVKQPVIARIVFDIDSQQFFYGCTGLITYQIVGIVSTR